MLILKYFQSEIFLRSSSPLCYPGRAAGLTLAVFGELQVPLEGLPLSASWRCSLGQNGVWPERGRVLPIFRGWGRVAR